MFKNILTRNLAILGILLFILTPVFDLRAHNDLGENEIKESIDFSENFGKNSDYTQAIIYYNEACGMCASYVASELPEMLREHGVVEFIKKDYLNDKSNRPAMNKLMAELGVPLRLQSHIMTFVGEKFILGGHVPTDIINDLFAAENSWQFKRLIVYQDKMHDEVENYQVWAIPYYAENFVGEIQTYSIDTPVTEYLNYLKENEDKFKQAAGVNDQASGWHSLLPVVLVSGFLDGLNPCAFAVLLFFIAFLFSLKKSRRSIWKMGLVYISAIYLAYLAIGFGLLKAILFSNSPHFMAKVGAWLVITLGLINLINHFFPHFPLKLRLPQASKETLQYWIHKATLPAAFVLGFLVGLCTFPCSGGIYVAIIGLLAAQTTYWTGVGYILLYNIMFVAPLFIILILSGNKFTVEKLTKWEQSESRVLKILAAITMIVLGAVILIWFT